MATKIIPTPRKMIRPPPTDGRGKPLPGRREHISIDDTWRLIHDHYDVVHYDGSRFEILDDGKTVMSWAEIWVQSGDDGVIKVVGVSGDVIDQYNGAHSRVPSAQAYAVKNAAKALGIGLDIETPQNSPQTATSQATGHTTAPRQPARKRQPAQPATMTAEERAGTIANVLAFFSDANRTPEQVDAMAQRQYGASLEQMDAGDLLKLLRLAKQESEKALFGEPKDGLPV